MDRTIRLSMIEDFADNDVNDGYDRDDDVGDKHGDGGEDGADCVGVLDFFRRPHI